MAFYVVCLASNCIDLNLIPIPMLNNPVASKGASSRYRRLLDAATRSRFRLISLISLPCALLCGLLVLPLFEANAQRPSGKANVSRGRQDIAALRGAYRGEARKGFESGEPSY